MLRDDNSCSEIKKDNGKEIKKNMGKKAILLVSFGTSHLDTKTKTLDNIGKKVTEYFEDYTIYEAYTSNIIINILQVKNQISIDTVQAALERILGDGINELIVQPTHLLNGIEYEKIERMLKQYQARFHKLYLGAPVLTATEDYKYIVKHYPKVLPKVKEQEAVLLMGHGTSHYANSVYGALNDMFQNNGYESIYVGTAEAYPYLSDLIHRIKERGYRKIYLTPFMMVAGEHAKNDMAGEEATSWENLLRKEGYEVEVILRGLGEYYFIIQLICKHIENAKEM